MLDQRRVVWVSGISESVSPSLSVVLLPYYTSLVFSVTRTHGLILATTTIADAGSLVRMLYIAAAIANASGVPYALTFLRRTNGALSRKADRLAGPGNGVMALTYAFNEKRSIERDRKFSTVELVRRWQWHNSVRTAVLVIGTIIGALAVAMD